MTYSSVMTQMQTLLQNSGYLAGVVRGDTLRLSKKPSVILTPDQCPGAVITRGQTRERWLSLYIRDRQTPYFVDLWFYSTNQDTDNATYEALLENVQHVFTSQPQLAGGADTTTSKVLYLTLTQDEPLPRPFATTSGRAVYHDRITLSVREEVRT